MALTGRGRAKPQPMELNRSPHIEDSSAAAPQPREGAGEDQTFAMSAAAGQSTLKSAPVARGVLDRSDTDNWQGSCAPIKNRNRHCGFVRSDKCTATHQRDAAPRGTPVSACIKKMFIARDFAPTGKNSRVANQSGDKLANSRGEKSNYLKEVMHR